MANYGLSSKLNIPGSHENFPMFSIITAPNVTAKVMQLKGIQDVVEGTNHIINYALLKFTPNYNNNNNNNNNNNRAYMKKNKNDVQIGFQMDASSIYSPNRDFPDYQMEIHSKMDNKHIGDFIVSNRGIINVLRPEYKDEAIYLSPIESGEFNYNNAIDLKVLHDSIVNDEKKHPGEEKGGKGCSCFSIRFSNGRMTELQPVYVNRRSLQQQRGYDTCDNGGNSSLRVETDGCPPRVNQQQQQRECFTSDSFDDHDSSSSSSDSKLVYTNVKYGGKTMQNFRTVDYTENKHGKTVTWNLIMVMDYNNNSNSHKSVTPCN